MSPSLRSAVYLLAFGLALHSPLALAQDAARTSAVAPAPGEVELKLPGGGVYIGTVTKGIPDGKGFYKDADGMMYEGEVRMGHRTGVAEGVFPSRDRYQGEWKDGKPDGTGKMVYMLGGSYEGGWKNGEREGAGVMVFAGTGRRAEVRFANDVRVDVAPAAPAAGKEPDYRYSIAADHASAGSRIPDKIALGQVPLDRGFARLTPEQQQWVRSQYPALEQGDDPAYPAQGARELYMALSKAVGRLELQGDVWVYVAVDAAGKVTSVTTAGALDPEIRRGIGAAAGMLPYTPARCAGQPCPGVWGLKLKLTLE